MHAFVSLRDVVCCLDLSRRARPSDIDGLTARPLLISCERRADIRSIPAVRSSRWIEAGRGSLGRRRKMIHEEEPVTTPARNVAMPARTRANTAAPPYHRKRQMHRPVPAPSADERGDVSVLLRLYPLKGSHNVATSTSKVHASLARQDLACPSAVHAPQRVHSARLHVKPE